MGPVNRCQRASFQCQSQVNVTLCLLSVFTAARVHEAQSEKIVENHSLSQHQIFTFKCRQCFPLSRDIHVISRMSGAQTDKGFLLFHGKIQHGQSRSVFFFFFLGNGFAYCFRVGGIIDFSIHDLNVTILA